jgi:hypothetical protein
MSTLDTIVKDYNKHIVLRDGQRQAFEYLHDKKGDILVTTFGTTFETFTEIDNRQTSGESASLPQYLGCNTVFDMRLRVTFLRRKTVTLQSNIAHRE